MDFLERFRKYFDSNANAIEAFVKLKQGGYLNDYNFSRTGKTTCGISVFA